MGNLLVNAFNNLVTQNAGRLMINASKNKVRTTSKVSDVIGNVLKFTSYKNKNWEIHFFNKH